MNVSVVTIAAGRHRHLVAQRMAVRRLGEVQDHVIVSMGDPAIRALVGSDESVHVVDFHGGGDLPLAAARNEGARTALRRGAELLVFLDVDCVPSPRLVEHYLAAAADLNPALLSGPVTYLAPCVAAPADEASWSVLRKPHEARPDPPVGTLLAEDDYDLFWSLNFALTASTWDAVGGFAEGYRGYGAEDTDFAYTARRLGVPLVWVGGADAFHLHHAVSSPPVEHLRAIVRNSRTFHARWGSWPMVGWLRAFEEMGLVRWTPTSLELTGPGAESP